MLQFSVLLLASLPSERLQGLFRQAGVAGVDAVMLTQLIHVCQIELLWFKSSCRSLLRARHVSYFITSEDLSIKRHLEWDGGITQGKTHASFIGLKIWFFTFFGCEIRRNRKQLIHSALNFKYCSERVSRCKNPVAASVPEQKRKCATMQSRVHLKVLFAANRIMLG